MLSSAVSFVFLLFAVLVSLLVDKGETGVVEASQIQVIARCRYRQAITQTVQLGSVVSHLRRERGRLPT